MARHGKSWNDILKQTNRLYSMNDSTWRHSPSRENRVSEISSRYLMNLQRTSTVKNARKSLLSMRKGNGVSPQMKRLMNKVESKKFSRSTYAKGLISG